MRKWLHGAVAAIAGCLLGGAGAAAPTPLPESGYTSEGDPYLGSKDAPVVIEEWSDYLCPFCARHFTQTTPQLIDRYVREGKVRLVFRDFPIAALHPTSERGHVAARCAGEQGPANYWVMHDALFTRQKEWNRLPDPAAFLAGLAEEQGLDAQKFASCVASKPPSQRIEANRVAGDKLGFNGTPSFRLATADGKIATTLDGAQPFERFDEIVQALLAGKTPPAPAPPPRPELPNWARPDGWKPDPARPGFNVSGDAYKGSLDARMAVIVFTDYQCAGCARHELDVQPALDREFVDSGQILWIVKSLPLKEHRQAVIAAAAAECAGDQGKFWPMHRALFSGAARWSSDRAEPELAAIAGETGLDVAAFRTCLAGRQSVERVLRDLYDAQDVVRTTPSFVLVKDGSGSLMGPLPGDQFAKILRKDLQQATGKEEAAAPVTPSP